MDFDSIVGSKNKSSSNTTSSGLSFSFAEGQNSSPKSSKFAFNQNIDTVPGLYSLAVKSGLEEDAKRALRGVGGEKQTFFSGGLVMDVMDVLNVGSYGVAGLLKGKGFYNGIVNRESFADDDALGKYGLVGKVAGMALDIGLDPLTYLAPWKMATKIPGLVRTLQAGSKAILGEIKLINVGEKTIQLGRDGGWGPLTYLADKLIYGNAVDKTFLEGIQSRLDAGEVAKAQIEQMMEVFTKVDSSLTKEILTFNDRGELSRRAISELQRTMSPDDIAKIEPIYKQIEDNSDRLVELGVLSKNAREKHADDYIQMMYDEYLIAKRNKPGGSKAGIGLSNPGRKDLTKEMRQELGVVEDAGFVLGATLMKQAELIKKAELQDYLSKNLALTLDEVGKFGIDVTKLAKVADSPSYQINKGKTIDFKIELNNLNKELRSSLKDLRKKYDANKDVVTGIKKLEAELNTLPKLTEDAYALAISDIKQLLYDGGVRFDGVKEIISDGQKALATSISKWLNRGSRTDRLERDMMSSEDLLSEFLNTREGLALERAFEDPQLMYNFRSMREFFDAARYPGKGGFKNVEPHVIDKPELIKKFQDKKLKEAESYQRRFGELKATIPLLKETDLKNVQKALVRAEAKYADLTFQKAGIIDKLEENALGNLAGKYLPKEIWEMVKGTFEPTKAFGEPVVLWFKHAKVIWNPASYPRNVLSAMIQNWWKLGLGPWKISSYLDAKRELDNVGPALQRMRKLGFHESTGLVTELQDNYIQSKLIGKAISEQTGHPLSVVKKKLKHWDRQMKYMYGHIDNVAKVAAFKHGTKNGLTDEEALKAAYAATFNYSHVTPFVHQMRRSLFGVPFITFNLKAAPLVASTLANAPHRISVFGKARNALFAAAGVEGQEEGEAMPEWMRDQAFMLRLPWKDSENRSMYFDMSYIMPVGAIMSGEYVDNPTSLNPALQVIKELSQNKTFGGQKIFLESDDRDTVVRDISVHVMKTLLPPLAAEQLPKGYNEDGSRVYGTFPRSFIEEDRGKGERTYWQEMFRIAGLGVQPFDLESRQASFEYNQKKALQQLLVQNGQLDTYNNVFVPKEKKLQTFQSGQPIYDREVDPLGR